MYSGAVSDRLTANQFIELNGQQNFTQKKLPSVWKRRREKQIASVEHYRKTDRPSAWFIEWMFISLEILF